MRKLPKGYFITENDDGTSTLYSSRMIPIQVEDDENEPARYIQGFERARVASWPTGKVHLIAPMMWARLDRRIHSDNPGANRGDLIRKLTRHLSVGTRVFSAPKSPKSRRVRA